ncbi:MAG: hypothetical protein M3N30_05570 [Bacteroidota bacterium]|nr:hypothetical protein [Bacteroidota bacterium]
MTTFIFTFRGKECKGIYLPSKKGKGWIKVIFLDHSAIIMPTAVQDGNNKTIWVQMVSSGEAVWPHDLIQVMGETIELTPSGE